MSCNVNCALKYNLSKQLKFVVLEVLTGPPGFRKRSGRVIESRALIQEALGLIPGGATFRIFPGAQKCAFWPPGSSDPQNCTERGHHVPQNSEIFLVPGITAPLNSKRFCQNVLQELSEVRH